jgi:mitochondrial fission protein ELM1
MDISQAQVLILSDGRTGHENQSRGVAAALGFPDPEVITLQKAYPQRWLKWLPVSLLYSNWGVAQEAARHSHLLMATGSGPTRASAKLKENFPHLFNVALLRPTVPFAAFDVVSCPLHDGAGNAPNLVTTLGNTNLITSEKLAQEGQRWAKRLSSVRGFKVAVLVGGPSGHGGIAEREVGPFFQSLIATLKAQHSEGAGLLITTSRRTTPGMLAAIQAELQAGGLPFHLWHPADPQNRDNPYFAYLHHAHAVLVSADSTSMVSEACTSGKPVYVWGERAGLPSKFQQLYTTLINQGRLVWWDGQFSLRAPAAPLLDTQVVAGFIRAKWQKRYGVGGIFQ